jgi:hypothetical protein
MKFLVILMPSFVLIACLILGAIFRGQFATRWWLLRLGLIPLICFALAGYVMTFPTPIPLDYDPMVHTNGGRLDFLAIAVWGLVVPMAYLIVALPLSLAYAIWKTRR